MAKIPFTLEAWLKDKSQRVETRDGRLVHNIWRVKEPSYTNNRKAEVCALIDGEEDALVFFEGGRYLPTAKDTDNPLDLFIVTPEEEMTEFEEVLAEYMDVSGFASAGNTRNFAKKYGQELLSLAREQLIKDGYVIEKKAFHDAVEKVDPDVMKEVSENVDKLSKEELTEFEVAILRRLNLISGENLSATELLEEAKGMSVELLDLARTGLTCQGNIVLSIEEFEKCFIEAQEKGRREALKDLPRW